MSSVPAVDAPHVPALIPILNPLIRRLLGTGLPFGPNVLLTVTGRSSGLPRTFPVALLELDGRQYVQSPFGDVNWVRNLRADGHATVTRGGQAESVEATEVNPEAAGPLLQCALAPYLRWRIGVVLVGRFFHIGRNATLDDYIAEARRHPMFEVVPRPSSTSG